MATEEGPRAADSGMVARIIGFSGRRPGLVLAAVLVLSLLGGAAAWSTPLDALPDLTDTQVIVATEWMGRGPTLIEDQVTYPLVTAMLSVPKVKSVRGFSMFSMSFVYVVFADGTDVYWARTRVLEKLAKLQGSFPEGANPSLGPDATGVGWVFQYALVDRSGKLSLDELRSYQDWTLRYALQSVPGVAEVASVGGFVKQYQITVDPNRLASFGLPLDEVV